MPTPLSPPKIGAFVFPPAFGNYDSALTATAGGGQTNALLMVSQFNRYSVVASGNDSAKLPPQSPTIDTLGYVGIPIIVRNDGANSMQVYGSGTDTINGVATATGVAVPAGKTAMFFPLVYVQGGASTWYMLLSA